jgi:hypothetical protein
MSGADSNSLLAMGASMTGTVERSIQALRPVGSQPASAPDTAGTK